MSAFGFEPPAVTGLPLGAATVVCRLVHDGLTLAVAAERLGLKRQRLAAILPVICPQAEKVGERGCPWSIPTNWVTKWEELLRTYAGSCPSAEGLVTLAHVLSYWPWTDHQVAHLLNDIAAGRMIPAGSNRNRKGLGALLLDAEAMRAWYMTLRSAPVSEMTIPDAALKLKVKQEVAYALARSGLLPTTGRRVGRRAQRRVSARGLSDFQQRYVFCRDLARTLGRSSRAVASLLIRDGVSPAAGPEIDGCRQLVFLRADVKDCLTRYGMDFACDDSDRVQRA